MTKSERADMPASSVAAQAMSYVYFIRSGPTGPVKIGVARDIASRLATLQGGNPEPLILLGSVPGSFEAEIRLHHSFWFGRMDGEWFRPSVGLLETAALANMGCSLEQILAFSADLDWRGQTRRSLSNLGELIARARLTLRDPNCCDKARRHAHRTIALCRGKMHEARPHLRRAGQHIDRMRERLSVRAAA